MSDLKPCPFCGSNARSSKWEDNKREFWEVWCADDVGCLCPGAADFSSKQEAYDLWDTRPIEDALRARIADLEDQVAAVEDALVRTVSLDH